MGMIRESIGRRRKLMRTYARRTSLPRAEFPVPRWIFRTLVDRAPPQSSASPRVGIHVPMPASLNAGSSNQGKALSMLAFDPLLAAGVVLATAATDAVYVMFTSAVIARRRVPAATWSSLWYLLSSFAVISYTNNWIYVAFAAAGSWIGAYATMTFLHGAPGHPPVPLNPPRDPPERSR